MSDVQDRRITRLSLKLQTAQKVQVCFTKLNADVSKARNRNQLKYFVYELHSIEKQPLSQEEANYSLWRYCSILQCSDIVVDAADIFFFCFLIHGYYNHKKNQDFNRSASWGDRV
jgi:hypothetical protein